jgi:F-type H+-transporting ATPase subunit b
LKRRVFFLIPALALALIGLRASARAAASRPHFAAAPSAPAISALVATGDAASGMRHEILTWVNFLILVGALAYFLRNPLSDFFADRLDSIQEGLNKGREAMAASDAKLAEVERKINGLEREIAEFRASSEREMQAEAVRLNEAAAREAERILAFAQAQIGAAVRSAEAELRRYAAGRALELAEVLIRQRLDEPARNALVSRFAAGVTNSGMQN